MFLLSQNRTFRHSGRAARVEDEGRVFPRQLHVRILRGIGPTEIHEGHDLLACHRGTLWGLTGFGEEIERPGHEHDSEVVHLVRDLQEDILEHHIQRDTRALAPESFN